MPIIMPIMNENENENASSKSHWNSLVFCDQSKLMLDLNMSHGKCLIFFSFPFFEFSLVIKLRKSDFESHWNTLIFFDQNKRS